MLKRHEDWQTRLHTHITECSRTPFEWGKHDCALFVADAILAHTGVDVAADFRGKYSDEKGAMATIAKVTGGKTVEDAAVYAANKHGLKELPSVLFAQRGDMVIFDGAEGPAVGIVCLNGREALFVGPAGLRKVKVAKCRRAWRIG